MDAEASRCRDCCRRPADTKTEAEDLKPSEPVEAQDDRQIRIAMKPMRLSWTS